MVKTTKLGGTAKDVVVAKVAVSSTRFPVNPLRSVEPNKWRSMV